MKYRGGRKNGHTLYFQRGKESSDQDSTLGMVIDPTVRRDVVTRLNLGFKVEIFERYFMIQHGKRDPGMPSVMWTYCVPCGQHNPNNCSTVFDLINQAFQHYQACEKNAVAQGLRGSPFLH